jgi:hypothetical protein
MLESYPKIKHILDKNIISYMDKIKIICSKIRSLKNNNKKDLLINIIEIDNKNLTLLEKNKNIIEKLIKLNKIILTLNKKYNYEIIENIKIILT